MYFLSFYIFKSMTFFNCKSILSLIVFLKYFCYQIIRSPAEPLPTFNLPVVAWIGGCSVGIIGYDENIVASVVDAGLNDGAVEGFWDWRKAVFGEVARIMLLSDKFLSSLLNLYTCFFRFLVNRIGRKGLVTHRHHKVQHITVANCLI